MSKNCPTYEGGPRVLAQHSLSIEMCKHFFLSCFLSTKVQPISIEEGNFCSLWKNPKPNGPKLEFFLNNNNNNNNNSNNNIFISFFFLEITNFKEEEGRNKRGRRRRRRIREVPPLKMGTPQASQPALASSSKVLLQSGNFPSKRKRPQKPPTQGSA